jgi:hypothetical protein
VGLGEADTLGAADGEGKVRGAMLGAGVGLVRLRMKSKSEPVDTDFSKLATVSASPALNFPIV